MIINIKTQTKMKNQKYEALKYPKRIFLSFVLLIFVISLFAYVAVTIQKPTVIGAIIGLRNGHEDVHIKEKLTGTGLVLSALCLGVLIYLLKK